jgi:Cu+-exporting ATPase
MPLIEASDLTLVSGDLRAAADAIRLSRATLRTIKQNLGWAFGYNLAAIPLAATGLLNPVIASLSGNCRGWVPTGGTQTGQFPQRRCN